MHEEDEDQEYLEKEKEAEAKVVIKTFLRGDGAFVPSSDDVLGFSSRGYGTPEDGNLKLTFHEALYLLGKGLIEVKDEASNDNVAFQALLERFRLVDADAWVKYLIYRDLRSRGYVVREGFGLGIDFRVYKRGEYGKSTADYLVLGVKEGQPVVVEVLARILIRVQSLKKGLIISVLNRRGEIVYYSLSRLAFGD